MGSISKITCTHCDWGDTHLVGLGNGSMFQNWTAFKGHLSLSERQALENRIGQKIETGVFCSENKIFKCPDCQCVSVKLTFNVTNRKNGIDYSNEVTCDSCKTALVTVYDGTTPQSEETLNCPKCKNNSIKVENAGIWD